MKPGVKQCCPLREEKQARGARPLWRSQAAEGGPGKETEEPPKGREETLERADRPAFLGGKRSQLYRTG